MRLFLGLMLLSLNVFAVEWNDLEFSKNYKLTQGFQLPQTERSGSLLEISIGDQVELIEIMPLVANVVLYKFQYKNCPGPAMKTEMEIIPVQATSPVVEVGAQLETECVLEIFIESKDLFTQSFFE